MRKGIIVVAGSAIALLSACGGVQPDAHYDSAESLRSAMDSEGYRCTEVVTTPVAEGYGEELSCEEGHSIVTWEDELPDYVRDPGMTFAMGGLTGRHYLLGDTWVIATDNGDMLDEMQEPFGGQRVEPNEDMMRFLEESS